MSKRARILFTLVGFLILNLALSALPAVAGPREKTVVCDTDENGNAVYCCVGCWFFGCNSCAEPE